MSELDPGIQQVQASDSTPSASRSGYGLTLCLDWNRMLIHRKTIRAIGHPQRVRLLINPSTRHFCVQGCDEKEPCSFAVPQDLSTMQESFYIHSKFLLSQICALMGWNPVLSYRVFGKINTHTNVLDFDLNRYMEVRLNEFLENDEVPEEFMKDYHRPSVPEQQEPLESVTLPTLPDKQNTEPVMEPPKPTLRSFMGGLFDSVRLPDGKGERND